eukprot:2182948-Rhodomonas_salina.2
MEHLPPGKLRTIRSGSLLAQVVPSLPPRPVPGNSVSCRIAGRSGAGAKAGASHARAAFTLAETASVPDASGDGAKEASCRLEIHTRNESANVQRILL